MRLLLILIAVIALLLIIRFLYRQSSPDLKKIGRYLAAGAFAVLFLFLLATGRLHWMFAALAAAVPVFFRMLPLLRYVPLLRGLYRKYQRYRAGGPGASQGQTSSVRSKFIRMTLNHDSGEVNGDILAGQFSGKNLQDLSLQELFSLMHECRDDSESVSLLVAYLDRQHPDWREQADSASASESRKPPENSASMSVDEAFEILGLERDATKAEIKEAHRKLISKLHPDHGGSNYLSAKINLAKDTLLKNK